MAQRGEIDAYLHQVLQVDRFKDYGPNGLQVEGKPEIRKIVSGVTASLALIEAAVEQGADALLVHHGLFWRGQDGRLTGCVLFGDVADGLWYLDLIKSGQSIEAIRSEMMFGRALAEPKEVVSKAAPPEEIESIPLVGRSPASWAAYIRARAPMARVVEPHRAASVLAMKASVESRKVAPRIAPDSRPVRGSSSAAAPQAQAAAASIAPSSEGRR